MQGIYGDGAAQFAGNTTIFLKYKFYHKYKDSYSIALGGSYVFRKNWSDVSGYKPESGFKIGKKYESRYLFTAELKYYHYLSKKSDIAISILYGHQHNTFTFTIGYRYWINSIVKLRECDSCGDKKFNRKPIRTWIKRHIHW